MRNYPAAASTRDVHRGAMWHPPHPSQGGQGRRKGAVGPELGAWSQNRVGGGSGQRGEEQGCRPEAAGFTGLLL